MPRQTIALSLAVLALAACGKSAPDEQPTRSSADANQAAAQAAFQFQPGKYRTTVAIQKIEIPGMPPAMAEQMKAMMSKAASIEHCMSPEQSARGIEAMKEHMARGKCRFDKFEAAGGKVRSQFSCQTGEGMAMKSSSEGSYTATGSQVAARADMTGPDGKTIHVEQTVTTERIGECG